MAMMTEVDDCGFVIVIVIDNAHDYVLERPNHRQKNNACPDSFSDAIFAPEVDHPIDGC